MQVSVGCRCSSSSNFLISSVVSWCCLGTLSLSLAITLSLSSLLQDVLGVCVPSPLFQRSFSLPSHHFFSFSLLPNLSFSPWPSLFLSLFGIEVLYFPCVQTLFLSLFGIEILSFPCIEALFLSFFNIEVLCFSSALKLFLFSLALRLSFFPYC